MAAELSFPRHPVALAALAWSVVFGAPCMAQTQPLRATSEPARLDSGTLEVPLRDDTGQTRAIMRAHAAAVDETPPKHLDLAPFLALQQWLEVGGERRVTVPFGMALAELLPADAVRMRRDFRQLLTCLQALALLRQCQRSRSATGAIEATIEDYASLHWLFGDVFDDLATEGLTPAIRETVEAVRVGEEVSETALASRLGIAKSTASYRVGRALKRGWLVNNETRRGCPAKLARGEPLPDAVHVLPSADAVREVFERSNRNPGIGVLPAGLRSEGEEDR